jgi:uncharacterized membrane protein YfhO
MKKRGYFYNLLIAILIIGIVFTIKNLFPFGSDSIIWEDLAGQITPMYYHFYDSVWNGNSLFISYASGNGINFYGNLGYYLISPFTLVVLAFPRDMIPQAVNVVLILKVLTCSLTFMYVIQKLFPKLNTAWVILLSNLYAFSSYTMCLYIIPNFIDIVYMFPLIILSLMYLLQDKPVMYVIVMTVSLIMNFYLTIMVLMFIVLAGNLYLFLYKPADKKKCITNLGFGTVISLLISCVVLAPTLLEINESARFGFTWSNLLSSHFGPYTNKAVYLLSSGFPAAMAVLLIKKKKDQKFTKYLAILLVMMLLPIIIEPMNKMWHFGSYVCLPYRYGFITVFLFLVAGAYYISTMKDEASRLSSKVISIVITAASCGLMVLLAKKYYAAIQYCVSILNASYDKKTFIIVALFGVIAFASTLLLFILNKNRNKFTFSCLTCIVLVFTITNGLFNAKIDTWTEGLQKQYSTMNALYDSTKQDGFDAANTKIINYDFTDNNSLVSGYHAADSFTSLTNNSSFETLQRLGYDSYWMNTMSSGGNLFTDMIMGYQYVLSGTKITDDNYQYVETYKDLYLYRLKYTVSKGYLLKNNVSLTGAKNTFEATNRISQELMGQNVFTSYTDFTQNNLVLKDGKITVTGDNAYFEKTIQVEDEGILYFEIFNSYRNITKMKIFDNFDVYVNGQLMYENYPDKPYLNTIDLGKFKNQEVTVKIMVKKDCTIDEMSLGLLNVEKLSSFSQNTNNVSITYQGSKAVISYTSSEDGILYVPINALKGFTATLNGEKTEIVKVFDNYIGINVQKGENTIQLNYVPNGLLLGAALTGIGIVLLFLYCVWLKKGQEHQALNTFSFYAFIALGLILFAAIYAMPAVMFILSFII